MDLKKEGFFYFQTEDQNRIRQLTPIDPDIFLEQIDKVIDSTTGNETDFSFQNIVNKKQEIYDDKGIQYYIKYIGKDKATGKKMYTISMSLHKNILGNENVVNITNLNSNSNSYWETVEKSVEKGTKAPTAVSVKPMKTFGRLPPGLIGGLKKSKTRKYKIKYKKNKKTRKH